MEHYGFAQYGMDLVDSCATTELATFKDNEFNVQRLLEKGLCEKIAERELTLSLQDSLVFVRAQPQDLSSVTVVRELTLPLSIYSSLRSPRYHLIASLLHGRGFTLGLNNKRVAPAAFRMGTELPLYFNAPPSKEYGIYVGLHLNEQPAAQSQKIQEIIAETLSAYFEPLSNNRAEFTPIGTNAPILRKR